VNKTALSIAAISVIFISGCIHKPAPDYSQHDFPNLLDITAQPADDSDDSVFFFADRGAWFGFSLFEKEARRNECPGFTGPFLMHTRKWLGKKTAFVLYDDTGKKMDMNLICSEYLPGRLYQKMKAGNINIVTNVVFISSKTALFTAEVENTGKEPVIMNTRWNVHLYRWAGMPVYNGSNVVVPIPGTKENMYVATNSKPGPEVQNDSLVGTMNTGVCLNPGKRQMFSLTLTVSREAHWDEEERHVENALRNSESALVQNQELWNGYIQSTLSNVSKNMKKEVYTRTAVKSLMTLMVNYRAPKGDLLFGGFLPSAMIGYFNGFWAWDSWKHAAAAVRIDPAMAKEQMRAMFAYQDGKGMIPDVIYTDKEENNLRDSKPPLAAWAVWKIYEETWDTAFVREMFEKLEQYHTWWYTDRDADNDSLCEYGSTDGTLVAAKWESGMDDAVRFDHTAMVQSSENAWSMNQESVCLNSFLYKEKICLARMADVLSKKQAAGKYKKEALRLKIKVQSMMYDDRTGFFYDTALDNESFIRVKGSEGWAPLWAGIASEQQAESVKNIMADADLFNTYVPLPTVAADEPGFMTGYWRGPVWLDQVYFGVEGLRHYGFEDFALTCFERVIENCDGLAANGPIRENYNPLTGSGMKVNHFSWSAAALLLMYWQL